MTKSPWQVVGALAAAVLIACGLATITLIAQGACGNPLACFEPGQESEIWQALTPVGQGNDTPACDNSEVNPNRVREDSRQCVRNDENNVPYPVKMPPSLGQMLDPFALAVDGETIYVSDQSNHRIQAFTFDGTPIKIAHPIGDAVMGTGPYGPYPADSRMTGNSDPITGYRLYAPDGIAVDAAHTLIVGDYSGFVNAFNPDGTLPFASQRMPIVDTILGLETKASGIAIKPGTTVLGFGVPAPPNDPGRIVVTDRLNCFVYIYDSGFNLLRQIPDVPPANPTQGGCLWDEQAAPLGYFSSPVAAAFDNNGHLYISDYDNNRIQILDSDGNSLGEFGRELFQYPWGVAVDQYGRVMVADTENQRLAIFTVDYSGATPDAQFQFELDAKGTLNGFPTAIASQSGSGPGLDPAGRIIVTDTINNRLQRFQLPDLAIINPIIDTATNTGTFQVVVPAGKPVPVTYVGVSAVGTNATVLTLNGVAPANTAALDPLNTALQNATVALGTTIAPAQIATYAFSYVPTGAGNVSFVFNAVGNNGATSAEARDADVNPPCTDCVSTHTIYRFDAPGSVLATESSGWYNAPLSVRVNATTTHPDGLAAIGFQFISGPESSGQRWGGSVHLAPASGPAAFTDIEVISEGVSTFRYWAVGADGSVENPHEVTLSLDLTPPTVRYTFAESPNAYGWFNHPVPATYVHLDARSGPVFTGVGTIDFPNEGHDQFQELSATDRAGNVSLAPIRSDMSANGGFPVNIDMGNPLVTAPAPITIIANGDGYAIAPGSWVASSSDPNLSDNTAGSGVVSMTNPGTFHFPVGTTTWTFTATDAAGNFASATSTIAVNPATGSIAAPNAAVQYGQTLTVSATVSPNFASGSVSFTYNAHTVSAAVVGGVATASFPNVLDNVGGYTMQVNYSGSTSVTAAATTATVTVTAAPLTITAAAKSKVYGTPDPALTYSITIGQLFGSDAITGALVRDPGIHANTYAIKQGTLGVSSNYGLTFVGANFTITPAPVTVRADSQVKTFGATDPAFTYQIVSGALVPGDQFAGTLSRDAGEAIGSYLITQGTLTLGPNYTLTYQPGTLDITIAAIFVTAHPLQKVYGDPDPVLTYNYTPALPPGVSFSGALTREPGNNTGNYQIQLGTLALPAGFQVVYFSETFSINQRPATVFAGSGTKVFGASDPAIAVTSTGFLPGETFALSVSRDAGENVGTYGTHPAASGPGLGNYNVSYVPGLFNITRATVQVSANAKSITYGDAAPFFDFTYGPFPGNYTTANVTATPICGVNRPHTAAGSYDIVCAFGAIDSNVDFAYVPAAFTVGAKPATLDVSNATRVYGQGNPVFSATPSGLVGADTLNYTLGTTAGLHSNVGSYPITATLGTNSNYSVTVHDGSLSITPAPATVTANAQSKVYGSADPVFTYTTTGMLAGDTLSGAATRAAGNNVGTYAITQGTLANPNYTIAFVGSNLAITPKAATLTANNAQKLSGESDPPLTTTPSGFVTGDAVTFSATRAAGEAIGTYTITPKVTGASAGNYTVTLVNGIFTIVVNNHPPVCTTAYGGEIWPPNHKKFYAAPINGVTDPDGGAITITVTGIWQDEPIDSTGDGRFSPDGQGVGTSTAWVRGERNGHQNSAVGDGRVYEIMFKAVDNKGALCTGSVFYTVPHDQGQRSTAIDSGVRYDSTGVIPGARDKSQIHQNSPQ